MLARRQSPPSPQIARAPAGLRFPPHFAGTMASGGGGRRRGKVVGRKKRRKGKYLSLSRCLAKAAVEVPQSPVSSELAEEVPEEGGGGLGQQQQQQQVEAFVMHTEPSTLFAAAPSLTDILGASSPSGGVGESSGAASPGDVSGGSGRFAGEEEDLARRALRGRERWVYCGSASSPSAATTTTTSSSCSSAASTGAGDGARPPLLKLDYEEVLAAWAGRGSFYIGGSAGDFAASVAAGPAVPKLELDTVFVEVGPSHHAAAWSAPATTAGRAESVRRYKEKRHARLYSKRIRYEVRRLNAVRRSRLKGRFISDNEGPATAVGGELQATS